MASSPPPRPPSAARSKAHVAVFTSVRDPHTPSPNVAALRPELAAVEADWQLTDFSGAYHAFTDRAARSPERGRAYDPLAHRLSWAATLAVFDLKLRGKAGS